MFEKNMKNSGINYVSCIKINGVPILPPLITHAKRKEMHKYKQQAIKLEKRLKRERELRQYISKYYVPNVDNCENLLLSNTLEHKLSFEENIISEIIDIENIFKTNLSKTEVPYTVQKRAPKLSCDLQVSQYINNEFTILTSFGKCKSDVIRIDEPNSQDTENILSTETKFEDKVGISDVDSQKPKLIRSNSYILETPSPLLLEHLKKQSESLEIKTEELQKNSEDKHINEKNVMFADPVKLKANRDEYIFQEDYDFYLDDSYNTDISRSESELKNISNCLSDQISNNGDITVIESQYQLKEFIDNNVPQMLDDTFLDENSKEIENSSNRGTEDCKISDNTFEIPQNNSNAVFLKDQLSCYDDESLKKILNNIPEIYSKQIVELLEKQKQEQLLKINTYMKLQHSCIYDTLTDNEQNETNHCSFNMSQDMGLQTDLDQNSKNKTIESPGSYRLVSDSISLCNTSLDYNDTTNSLKIDTTSTNFKELCNESVLNYSHEKFPNHNEEVVQQLKEDQAASIIGAAAKGYLIRRLMRTDRIQRLIQTIRDALICAMQLHSENSDNINESDVELHRRLIQQVSAACFEFHDVFFSLSTSDQMALIRLDRERQKEKLKRPLSRTSSAGKSSRSSRSTK